MDTDTNAVYGRVVLQNFVVEIWRKEGLLEVCKTYILKKKFVICYALLMSLR